MTNKIINLDEVRKRRKAEEQKAQGGLFQKLSRIDELEDVLDTMDEFAASTVNELNAALKAVEKNSAQAGNRHGARSAEIGEAVAALDDLGITTRDELASLIDYLEAEAEGEDMDGAE